MLSKLLDKLGFDSEAKRERERAEHLEWIKRMGIQWNANTPATPDTAMPANVVLMPFKAIQTVVHGEPCPVIYVDFKARKRVA